MVYYSADIIGLDESACLVVKNIGKPCAGEPQARFDEGGQGKTVLYSSPNIHIKKATKIALYMYICTALLMIVRSKYADTFIYII